MARSTRVDVGGYVYHVLNRANARTKIFDTTAEYRMFEEVLEEGVKKFNMALLAYCFMPNHWHLVLCPANDGDLARFMGWITNTHTRRWHAAEGTIGQGHLYQGRYKSFVCETDKHFITLVRYVERNAKKAGMVSRAEKWRWSSFWRREYGTTKQKKMLAPWPVRKPVEYLELLNQPLTGQEYETLEHAVKKNVPYGTDAWQEKIIDKFGLQQSVRGVGRPKKGG